MWVKQCHHPFGNGKHTTCKNGDLGHGLLLIIVLPALAFLKP